MKRRAVPLTISIIILALFALGAWLVHGVHFDVLEPAGAVASQEKSVLLFALGLSAVVVVPVFILLGTFAWKYRESNTRAKYTPEWSSNTKLEALWWGIPIILIVILSSVTYVTSHSLDPQKRLASSEPALNVQVIALQWKWLFIYPDYNVATINQLPVAVDRPIHFTLAADAPMNGFWIPKLGTQVYAMNGMSMELNLVANSPGNFAGYASNINGKGYADMKFMVKATNTKDFTAWMKQAQKSPQTLDMKQYTALAKAGTSTEKTYSLQDNKLYDQVVSKYMGHGMSTSEESDSSMNMHMEGNH